VEWHVQGGGQPAALAALRRLPEVSVHGYFRAGTLPAWLARDADLTLLPSVVPETYSLVVSESLVAGVPVLATAQGAMRERLSDGGGLLVPPAEGADGLAAALERWLTHRDPVPPPRAQPASAADAARAWATLHEELLRVV
jgi:glycosyltransferase involved in cell wall biosynthesis